MDENRMCSSCNNVSSKESYFCSQCGRPLQDQNVTAVEQIKVYALSILFPPFGLLPGIKFLLRKEKKSHMVGWIAIVLTLISFLITVLTMQAIMSSVTQTVTQQLNAYRDVNY